MEAITPVTMNRCSLVQLYLIILVTILFAWSTDEDLCYFDTAVCNHQLRNYVLSAMSKGFLMHTSLHDEVRAEFVRWLLLRGINLNAIVVGESLSLDEITLLRRTKRLYHFTAEAQWQTLHQLVVLGIELIAVHLHYGYNWGLTELKQFGSRVTGLSVYHITAEDEVTISSHCPNLKHISVETDIPIGPIIDKCSLDTISHCNLAALKHPQSKWYYHCDLKRTTANNESSVCLGEGKYYHLTSLSCRKLSEDDVKTLTPLLINVKSVLLQMVTEAHLVAQHCRNLSCLKVHCYSHFFNVNGILRCNPMLNSVIVRSSPDLTDLFLDQLVSLLIERFPLLGHFQSDERCSTAAVLALTEFCAIELQHLRVQFYFDGVETVLSKQQQRLTARLHEFGDSELSQFLNRSPNLLSVELQFVGNVTDEGLLALKQCIQLTKVCILGNDNVTGDGIVRCLSHLPRLTSLQLNIKNLSQLALSLLLQKHSHLRRLSLRGCAYFTGTTLASIVIEYCPELLHLDMGWSQSEDNLTSDDVIKVLQGCKKLQHLNVSGSCEVTDDILPSIKSPPLRYLNVQGTRISKRDMIRQLGSLSESSLEYVV